MREKHRTEEREITQFFFHHVFLEFQSRRITRRRTEKNLYLQHNTQSKQTSKNKKEKCNESNKNRSKFDSLLQRLVDDVANTKKPDDVVGEASGGASQVAAPCSVDFVFSSWLGETLSNSQSI